MRLETFLAFSRALGLSKEAQLDIRELLSKYYPELIGAGIGAGLGAGAGWASDDPKTRARKMFIGGILGALLGGGSTYLGRKFVGLSDASRQAARAVEQAALSAGQAAERAGRAGTYTLGAATQTLAQAGLTLETLKRALEQADDTAGAAAATAAMAGLPK